MERPSRYRYVFMPDSQLISLWLSGVCRIHMVLGGEYPTVKQTDTKCMFVPLLKEGKMILEVYN